MVGGGVGDLNYSFGGTLEVILTAKESSPSRLISARSIVNVCGQMFRQIIGTCKTFAATLTVIRPLTRVYT